ncbi:hypothetical protein ACEQ6C_38210, partial [Rhizobium ruizarguesonis]
QQIEQEQLTQLEQLQGQLAQKDAELQAAQQAYEELSDQHVQTLEQLHTATQQLDASSKQLEDTTSQLHSTSAQLDETSKQLDAASEQLEAAKDRETQLLATQQQFESAIAHWEQQELVWTEKLDRKDAELQTARLAYQELSDKYDQTLEQLHTAT